MKKYRSAFTLIELLIVISIIAILVALVAVAVFRVSGAQYIKRTEQGIKKLDSAMNQQWQVVLDKAKKETSYFAAGSNLFTSLGNDKDRAQVVWVKARLKMEFPQTYNEAIFPIPGTNLVKQSYVDYLQGAISNDSPETQSAVCLYMILSQGRNGMDAFDPEQAMRGSIGTVPKLGGTFNIFLDGWGTPITFIRWPIGSYDLAGKSDPQDPLGKLIGYADPNGILPNYAHPISAPYPSALTPTICSAGPDKQFAIGWNGSAALAPQSAQETDNIYSFRLKKN